MHKHSLGLIKTNHGQHLRSQDTQDSLQGTRARMFLQGSSQRPPRLSFFNFTMFLFIEVYVFIHTEKNFLRWQYVFLDLDDSSWECQTRPPESSKPWSSQAWLQDKARQIHPVLGPFSPGWLNITIPLVWSKIKKYFSYYFVTFMYSLMYCWLL